MTGNLRGDKNLFLGRYAVLALADLAAKAVGFGWTLAIIHYYGSAGLGVVTFAAAFVAYALLLGSCGTDMYAVREVASGRASLGAMISTLLQLRFLLGLGAYVLLLAVAFVVPPLRVNLGLIALFGLSLFTGAISAIWVPQAVERTNVLAAANFTIQAAIWGFIVIMARQGCGLWSIAVAQVAAEGLVGLVLLGWSLKLIGRFQRPLPRIEWAGIVRHAAPIGMGRVLRTIALGSDLLVLAFFVSMDQVGWYAGANKLFLVGTASIGLYAVNLFPRLAKSAVEARPALRQSVMESIKLIVPLAAVTAVVLIACARPLLRMLFSDPTFEAAAPALRLLLAALVVSLLNTHLKSMLVAQRRQRTDLHLTAMSAGGHVAFKLALVPVMGMAGAALGTLLGEALYLVAGLWTARADLFTGRQAVAGMEAKP